MKKIILLLLALVVGFPVVLAETTSAYASQEQKIYCTATIDDEFADNKVMVVLTESASRSDKDYSVADFISYGCIEVKDLTEFATQTVQSGVDNELVNTENYKRVLSLTLNQNSKENVLQVINSLIEREDVLYVGPDYIMTTSSTSSNDTYATSQWAINNIGLKDCWDFTQGSTEVVVGVMDTGIDGTHPDLSSSIINSLCRDFTSGQEVAVDCPTDSDGHGTHVAGIIGAVGNNNLGITGVNWNVKLVSLKVFGGAKNSLVSYVGAAIDYAQRVGIKILNFSGGWENDQQYNDMAFDSFIETYSGLLICAAGNDAKDIDAQAQYPASYDVDNVLSVGAIDSSNHRCSFSNYGEESVDIYAPGENILSSFTESACEEGVTFYDGTKFCEFSHSDREWYKADAEKRGETLESLAESFYSIYQKQPSLLKQTTHHSNGYHYMRGTSMATPYVAGAAALLLSLNSNLTVSQLKAAILNSAENINIRLPDNTSQSVKKLNAYNAVKYVLANHNDGNIVVSGSKTRLKRLNGASDIYNKKKSLLKLTVNDGVSCRISVSANYATKVTLFDDSFNVETTLTSGLINNYILDTPGVYYLQTEFVEEVVDTITIYIDEMGVHSHSGLWMYYSNSQHRRICSCGETFYESHCVEYQDSRDGYATCLGCGANLNLGLDFADIVRSIGNKQVTLNGSYILPSGIVVLKEEDIDAYLAGTLVFYNENELPTCV